MATTIRPLTAVPIPRESRELPATDVLGAYWHALNSLDADLLANQFARDGSLQIGDHQRAQGRVAIRRGLVQLFAELAAVESHLITAWSCDGLFIMDADVRFVFENGGQTMVPITTQLWIGEGQILSCRLLLNADPAIRRATRGFGRNVIFGALSA